MTRKQDRRTKLISWLFIISLLLLAGLTQPLGLMELSEPPAPVDQTPPRTSKVGSPSAGLGPSVDISYQVQNKTFHEVELFTREPATLENWWWGPDYSDMYLNDSSLWSLYVENTNTSEFYIYVNFKVLSPYDGLSHVHYRWRWGATGGDAETVANALIIMAAAGKSSVTCGSNVAEDTYTSGNQTVSSDHVVDGYIHGYFYIRSVDNEATQDRIDLDVDFLVFEYNAVTETRRSTYDVVGGTVRSTVDWTTWDYNVDTTLAVPSAWAFQDVNPDCAESSDVFSCLVPEGYTAVYTADVLATANWQEYQSWSFEGELGENSYTTRFSPTYNYTHVLDGAASLNMAFGTDTVDLRFNMPVGDYYAVFSVFSDSSGADKARFNWYDNGDWNTLWLDGYIGEWHTFVQPITLTTYSGGTFLRFEMKFAGADIRIDGFTLYNSSVVEGTTITGTTRHIHPNGHLHGL